MSKFVGREAELGLLNERLGRALDGQGSLVFISADPGAGKSTLIGRFLDDAAANHPDAMVIRATCSEQYGAGEPYQPFVETFRHLTREQPTGKRSFRDVARQIAPYWLAAIPVAGEVIAASLATASELKQSLSSGGPSRQAPSEEALFFQYTELFFAASNESPVVLFLDDLHWADRATVSLLTHIGRRIGERRVLIVGSYRPTEVDAGRHPMRDARQELQRYKVAEEIALQPLGTAALADLITAHTGTVPGRQVLDWLERRAGTNALFFEELLGWLVAQGFTRENHGELELVRTPLEVEIPRSAESTIEKRLDRLDEETRRVLEYASVQGNDFDSVGLSRLLEMDELELEEALDPIARVHRLIRPKGELDLPNGDIASVYHFSHSLIHEVLHNGLQGKRRILLHRKMAQIVEDLFGTDDSVAHKLAIHFEEGRQGEKACDYALRAAERASRVYAHWDALDQIQRALRNAPDDTRRSIANERLGDEYLSLGRYAEAMEALDSALGFLEADGDARRGLSLRHKRALGERNQGHRPLDELLELLRALRAEAQQLGAHTEECGIIWHIIDLPGGVGKVDITLAREAHQIAEEHGDAWLRARGREVLGLALAFGGEPKSAIPEFEAAIRLYSEVGDTGREAGCRNNLALARVFLGDFRAAAEEFAETARIFDNLVDPVRSGGVRTNLGALLRIMGDYDAAESVLHETVRIAERLSAPVRTLSPLQNLAEVEEGRERWDEAEIRWRQLLQRAQETGYVGEQITAHCGIGTARLRLGDLEGAVAAERAARALVTAPVEELGESGEALQLFSARLAAASGEIEGAIGMLDRLLAATEGGDRYLTAVYRLEKASLYPPDSAWALALAEQARAEFLDIGAAPQVAKAEELIRQLRGEAWALN